MKLLKRFGYYFIGLSLGSLLVLFIWKGKDVAFPYGPDARTLSSIRKKQLEYSKSAEIYMQEAQIDTTAINSILQIGSVDFGKSKPRQKPCAEYFIYGEYKKKSINFYIKRCDSTAIIENVWINNISNDSYPYGPEYRTLNVIRKMQLEYSKSAEIYMQEAQIDTTAINSILQIGSVDFGKSKPRQKPCAEYFISGTHNEKNIDLYVKRCDSIATISTVWLRD